MLLHDDPSSLEVTVVHKHQVVLIDVVAEEEEDHEKEADGWEDPGEDEAQREEDD